MTALRSEPSAVLTLSEQLDAMLLGWLERRSADPSPVPSNAIAVAVATVAIAHIPEVEAFCARWGMRLQQLGAGERWAAIRVEGPRLPVIGFTEITAMYRR